MRRFSAVDLFCGAGGESEGLRLACDAAGLSLDLTAVNHWELAVETHSLNHPSARHLCEPIDAVDPRTIHTPGSLDLLWASPECVHHSNARGGKPMNDQSRASAWHVVRWAEVLRPKWIGVENVREFLTWGPLGSNGRPLVTKRGTLFSEWVRDLRALGYTVDWRVLNAADYGAAQARRRLFVLARFDGARSRGPIAWPRATHGDLRGGLFAGELRPHRAAREVIDWALPSKSIFARDRPLADRTLERIADGLRRFGGPFAQSPGGRLLDPRKPLPTLTSTPQGGDLAVCQPFVIGQQSGATPRSVDDALPTLATGCAVSLVQPFLVKYYGSGANVEPITRPIGTLTTKDRFALVQPQIADIHFRMLQPHECAAGQGFGRHYQFAGTKTDVMKQIGNAVEVHQAQALNELFVRAQIAKGRAA